jgi:hypothetical protein
MRSPCWLRVTAVLFPALGATCSPAGPAVLPTYISSTLWILVVGFRSMEGAELAATSCSTLVFRYVRGCRTHLRWVYPYLRPFRGC